MKTITQETLLHHDQVEDLDITFTSITINCEPYDNFFTENMLVFDAKDIYQPPTNPQE